MGPPNVNRLDNGIYVFNFTSWGRPDSLEIMVKSFFVSIKPMSRQCSRAKAFRSLVNVDFYASIDMNHVLMSQCNSMYR